MKNPYATAVAGASLAGILAGCAASNVGTNPLVPENLKVPAGQTLSLVSPATGVQIYECGAIKTEPARFEWVFKAPEADLFDLSVHHDRQAPSQKQRFLVAVGHQQSRNVNPCEQLFQLAGHFELGGLIDIRERFVKEK